MKHVNECLMVSELLALIKQNIVWTQKYDQMINQ